MLTSKTSNHQSCLTIIFWRLMNLFFFFFFVQKQNKGSVSVFNSGCQPPRVFFILVRLPPSRNLVGTPFCTDGLPIFQRFLPSCVARTSIVNLVISVVHKIQFSLFRVFRVSLPNICGVAGARVFSFSHGERLHLKGFDSLLDGEFLQNFFNVDHGWWEEFHFH